MTHSDKENLERKLEHVISLGEMVCEQYVHITCTERSALLLSLYSAVKQTLHNVEVTREYMNKFILDIFRVDYDGYARKFNKLLIDMEKIAGAPMVVNTDNLVKPITEKDKILQYEEEHYVMRDDFPLTRLKYVRGYLIDNARHIYETICDDIKYLIADLEGISKDYYDLKGDEKRQQELYDNLRGMYLEVERKNVLLELEEELQCFFDRHGMSMRSIERFEEKVKDNSDILTKDVLDGWSAAFGILGRRDILTWDDVHLHFRNMEWLRLIDEMKTKIAEMEENGNLPESKRGDLFIVNFGKYIEKQTINKL